MAFSLIFFKNIVRKTRLKFVYKENVTLVEIIIGRQTFVRVTNWSKAAGVVCPMQLRI